MKTSAPLPVSVLPENTTDYNHTLIGTFSAVILPVLAVHWGAQGIEHIASLDTGMTAQFFSSEAGRMVQNGAEAVKCASIAAGFSGVFNVCANLVGMAKDKIMETGEKLTRDFSFAAGTATIALGYAFEKKMQMMSAAGTNFDSNHMLMYGAGVFALAACNRAIQQGLTQYYSRPRTPKGMANVFS